MTKTALALAALTALLALGGCQGSQTPPTTAEKCSSIDMEIAATRENDSIEQEAKDDMISGYQQEKADLNCP